MVRALVDIIMIAMETKKSSWPNWIQGIGTFMLGTASLIAVCKSQNIINQILKIQNQAKKIEVAVNMLTEQIISNQAQETARKISSPKLKSRAGIEKTIKRLSRSRVENSGGAYIPDAKAEYAINNLQKAKTFEEREAILRQSLMYQPAGILTNNYYDN